MLELSLSEPEMTCCTRYDASPRGDARDEDGDKIDKMCRDYMKAARRIREQRRKLTMQLAFSRSEAAGTAARESPTAQQELQTRRRRLKAQLEKVDELGRMTESLMEGETPGGTRETVYCSEKKRQNKN